MSLVGLAGRHVVPKEVDRVLLRPPPARMFCSEVLIEGFSFCFVRVFCSGGDVCFARWFCSSVVALTVF